MLEVLSVELKSDLEYLYKVSGDLLNDLENIKTVPGENSGDILERVKAVLMDIGGTLQKDIYNCDYVITMQKVVAHAKQEGFDGAP